MYEENFPTRAATFVSQRRHFIEQFGTVGEAKEEVGHIKDAMDTTLSDRAAQHNYIVYLNAMINGSRKVYNLIRHVCGEELFEKLISAGLKIVE